MVLKFDKHGLQQLDKSWGFPSWNITTSLLCLYLYLYLKELWKHNLHIKYKLVGN